jgi:predicted small secreted protein
MFKSKGAMIGVAAALVASALLVAGMAFNTTRGAATDIPFGGAPSGFPDSTDTGNPPAAEEEQPGTVPGTQPGSPAGTAPGVDPTGGAGAGNAAPGTLPSAGFGFADDGAGSGAMVILLALAGAALIGVGATVVSSSRRS